MTFAAAKARYVACVRAVFAFEGYEARSYQG